MLRRELNRLHIRLNGIRDLNSKPDAMFIVDIKREHNALAEARRLRVPVVAIVDTNTDPTLVDYPIAGNDDAIRSIALYCELVSASVLDGLQQEATASGADIGEAEEAPSEDIPAAEAATAEVAPAEEAPAEDAKADEAPAEEAKADDKTDEKTEG